MENTQGSPYRKYTFWLSIVLLLFGIFGFFLRSFITIQVKPIWKSLGHLERNQAIMKEDIKDLEKNYERYARSTLEVSQRMETLLIQIYKDKK